MIVHITLYAAPTDQYARGANKREGSIQEAIAFIEEYMTVNSFEVTHDQHNQSKDQLAIIKGRTDKSLAAFTAAMYSNPMITSRMKTLATNYDLAEISTRPQAHVLTEDEIKAEKRAQHMIMCNGTNCDPDYCPVHGT